MGTTPSKQTFDDIVSQLRENDITVTSKHEDRRFKYAVMKKNNMLFVVRQYIKTEKFSLRHPDRGIFYFNTIPEALEIVNSLALSQKECKIDATLWDSERADERELRFTFYTYDLQQAAREYELLKTKLTPLGVTLGQLTPKLQAITVLPYNEVDAVKTIIIEDFGIKWQDYSKKSQRAIMTPSHSA